MCSSLLAPRLVSNDCVPSESIYGAVQVCHEVLTWPWVALGSTRVSSTWRLGAFYCCIMAVSMGSAPRGENTVCLLLPLLLQPRREVLCSFVVLCCICYYCCCASQTRVNMSDVSMAPQVFFHPLISLLAYVGLSKHCGQCEQQDNWCREQDKQQQKWVAIFFFFQFLGLPHPGIEFCLLQLLHCYVLGHYHFLFISTENLSNTPLYCILKVEFNLNVRSGLLVILGSCKEK